MRKPLRPWTEEDMATARTLYAQHQNYNAVAKIMDRSPSTVGEQLQGLRGARRLERVNKAETTVPADVLADRERRRNLDHRDYTSAFFGDPLPGYSALERR
jgi:predicted transcriptional regulator